MFEKNTGKSHKIGYILNLIYQKCVLNEEHQDSILNFEDFISKIKNDEEFSQTYDLKIQEIELPYLERYNYWILLNYETGIEYDPSNVPDFDNSYYSPTPKKIIRFTHKNENIDYYD